MPAFTVKIKWGKELFEGVEVNTDEEPMVFKAQVYALTGVMPERQKIMAKGAVLKDDTWNPLGAKLRDGAMLLLMGSKEEDIPDTDAAAAAAAAAEADEAAKVAGDEDEVKLPAGLTNLGNTCYLNATVQCLKSVPEFCVALDKFQGNSVYVSSSSPSRGMGAAASQDAHLITVAMRDLYRSMSKGFTVPPVILLQVLHNAFPRFAERGQMGGYQQQDANECWVELMGMLKQKLRPSSGENDRSVIDQFFGLEFEAKTKCAETDAEPETKSVEKFLQFSCYIDKEVKYLSSGLKNRLMETMTKRSVALDRDAEYVKTLRVSRLPAYLTVQMVRFQFKQKDAVNAKILKDIKFPMMLDTFDLCTDELQKKLVPMRSKFKSHEDAIVEKSSKMRVGKEAALKKDREDNEGSAKDFEPFSFEDDVGSNNSGYYELQAVLTHKGRSSNSGHYVAWVRHKGDIWLECNDDDVVPVHVEDVLKLSGGGDWHTAYVLLYGPRKLPKPEELRAEETAKAPVADQAEKMETA